MNKQATCNLQTCHTTIDPEAEHLLMDGYIDSDLEYGSMSSIVVKAI